jgi:hypothetical protein
MLPTPTDRVIEYAKPKPPVPASRVLAGVCCVPAGLLGIFGTIGGLLNLVVYLFFEVGPTRERRADAFYSGVILLIGLVALVASIRWGRYAIRGPKDGG